MATITNANLSLKRDAIKKLVSVKLTAKINFTELELCMMKTCKDSRLFKVKGQLWGEDSIFFTGNDDFLYTFPNTIPFPDSTPNSTEVVTFETTVGENLLDEDWGRDEVYGKILLYNNLANTVLQKKSNVVTGWF